MPQARQGKRLTAVGLQPLDREVTATSLMKLETVSLRSLRRGKSKPGEARKEKARGGGVIAQLPKPLKE